MYFEVDGEGWATRQLIVYENGNVLKYDQQHDKDEYGILADQKADDCPDDFPFDYREIDSVTFERVWSTSVPLNR